MNDRGLPSEHWAPCPPGEFLIGAAVPKGTAPFGPFFLPLLDDANHHVMADNHRSGIGLHGGGSGLPDPLAPRQGWVWTHGCWRLQNQSLLSLVRLVSQCHLALGSVRCTVVRGASHLGPLALPAGPELDTEESQLDPDE